MPTHDLRRLGHHHLGCHLWPDLKSPREGFQMVLPHNRLSMLIRHSLEPYKNCKRVVKTPLLPARGWGGDREVVGVSGDLGTLPQVGMSGPSLVCKVVGKESHQTMLSGLGSIPLAGTNSVSCETWSLGSTRDPFISPWKCFKASLTAPGFPFLVQYRLHRKPGAALTGQRFHAHVCLRRIPDPRDPAQRRAERHDYAGIALALCSHFLLFSALFSLVPIL